MSKLKEVEHDEYECGTHVHPNDARKEKTMNALMIKKTIMMEFNLFEIIKWKDHTKKDQEIVEV